MTRAEFESWLFLNFHIWEEFELRAMAIVVDKTVKRWAAHAILQDIRWEMDWRFTNLVEPYFARRFNRRHKIPLFVLRPSAADEEPWD